MPREFVLRYSRTGCRYLLQPSYHLAITHGQEDVTEFKLRIWAIAGCYTSVLSSYHLSCFPPLVLAKVHFSVHVFKLKKQPNLALDIYPLQNHVDSCIRVKFCMLV